MVALFPFALPACGARVGGRPGAVAPTRPAAGSLETEPGSGMLLPGNSAPSPPRPPSLRRSDDYVVRIVTGKVSCTGTLIDEQRVLTAHHCVSERNERGHALDQNVSPERITVELGGDYLPWGEVGVKAVVAPPCGYRAGTGDLAILVLTRRLSGFPTLRVELDRKPTLGEAIEPVGFGRCALSADGLSRKLRLGGTISAVTTDNFRLLAGICPGDSGGPALSREHRLLGLVSQSAMDGDETTVGESEFTRLDRWRPLFANSAEIARGTPAAALPPLECTAPGG